MSFFRNFLFVTCTIGIVFISFQIRDLLKVPPAPQMENTWWGPGEEKTVDEEVKPFEINISQEILDDLNLRLRNARSSTPPLEGVAQQYGMNTKLLNEIVDFWKNKYNWRRREKFLNQYPQFTTEIQGLKIHFLHVKPSKSSRLQVIPLLLLHGWPGSIREFYEMIPLLTTPQKGRNFVFELIIPSLPGYGFSEGASKPGLGAVEMAVVFKNLMARLKFEVYYVQGGDWGAIIASHMAALYPEQVLGMHSNMCFVNTVMSSFKHLVLGNIWSFLVVEGKYKEKMYPVGSFYSRMLLETGYMHIQATKPDTVGVGLNDSPVGLAAYILEKFTTWTNLDWKDLPDGGLTKKFSYTNLLDNVMIYWVTGSITTSMRLYSETFNTNQQNLNMDRIPVKVPAACARFKYELAYQPDNILKEKYPLLLHSADYDDGGHFIAFEEPDVLAKDIWEAIEKIDAYIKKNN